MPVRKLIAIAAFMGIVGVAAGVFAQDDPLNEPSKPKTLKERLDNFGNKLDGFGKTIFGGLLPEKNKPPALPPKDLRPDSGGMITADDPDGLPAAPRAGGVLSTPKQRSFSHDDPTLNMDQFTPEKKPQAARRQVEETPQPAAASLHERLAGFRKSVFDSDKPDRDKWTLDKPNVARATSDKTGVDKRGDLREQVSDPPEQISAPPEQISAPPERISVPGEADTVSPDRVSIPPDRASEVVAEKAEKIEKAESRADLDSPYSEKRPLVAQRVVPEVRAETARPAQPIYDTDNDRPIAAESRPATAGDSPSAAGPAGAGVLFARKGPILSVETVGPRTITIGKESSYQVTLLNSGEVAAEELVVHVTLPAWAEVAGVEASAGDARPPETTQAGAIDWKVGRLDAKSRTQLTVKIIPRQSRPFDLAVRWDYKPVASQAMINVQEPKLLLAIEGPHEVLYGKKELYRLKLSNPGTGNADNVAIVLTPIGTGENVSASHKVGLLAAGEEKSLDVELTARQSGVLIIQAEAHGDGGLRAALAEKVVVHRAALKLDIAGPKVQFVGAVATYSIRVRNLGTAPARSLNFSMVLPTGAKYLSGIDGARPNSAEGKVAWGMETLAPDTERTFTLKCRLATVGTSRVRLNAVADDDVIASAEASLQVEAVANLTMDVKDPSGPVLVGDEAVYEVRVRNRGTKEAQNVEVLSYFSRGIEPTGTEGAPSRLGAGEVAFQPIASLAPGEDIVLKVRAKADMAGNHIFRAEVRCKPLNARLISEATNLYYTDAPPAAETARKPSVTNVPARADDGTFAIPPLVHGSQPAGSSRN
jgi:uncharacterized repeat protein (TIGR01451 family)